MYNFERRLSLTRKSFDDLANANQNNEILVFDAVDIFIVIARTITFVMQKELKNKEGFDSWYDSKQKELSEKYQHFVEMRNKIEKEGETPIKSGTVSIDLKYLGPDAKKVGTYTDPNGIKTDAIGKITHTRFFDKDRKLEIISECTNYLNYLTDLVSEAKKAFPSSD